MDNRWSEDETRGLSELDLLVYQSHLVGADPGLVVWGGGNTSIKVTEADFRGREVQVMHIKASGVDLKVAQAKDFPGLRLDDLLPLFDRDSMADLDMVDYLRRCLLDPASPRPSIETLLHAFFPYKSVVHSHADAVIALTNNRDATRVLADVYGDDVAVVEYLRPGFILAKKVGQAVRGNPQFLGAVLSNHGLFTWGETAQGAYDRHIDLVTRAEEYTRTKASGKVVFGGSIHQPLEESRRKQVAAEIAPTLRGLIGQHQTSVLSYDDSPQTLEFVSSQRGHDLSGVGPATPDHVIQTKHLPLRVDVKDPGDGKGVVEQLRTATEVYGASHSSWYECYTDSAEPMRDPYPRIVLVPGIGMWSAGSDALGALISGDMYRHTINVIRAAQGVGEYASLSPKDAFEAEYWPLELYKLTLAPPEKELAGQIALVTGGANGIGRAIAIRLAAEGAHVVITDIDQEGCLALSEEMNGSCGQGRTIGLRMDVTKEDDVAAAFQEVRLAYGGLDILVSNAGIAPVGALDQLPLKDWQRALDINTTGHFLVARETIKIMREQGLGGSLVFVGTKNVTSPGKDFGAYSASKAAEVQMAKVLAIENGEFGIRSNIVNPDAIFQGSGLWSREVREQRAQAHKISVDDLEDFYRQRNLLQARVTGEDVAETVLFLAGPRSAKTTGAMIPVDGGVRDAFPR